MAHPFLAVGCESTVPCLSCSVYEMDKAELRRQVGKDILVFGSHRLWRDLLAQDLVDELHLMIGPVVVGSGTPVFDGQPAVSLRRIDTRTWDGSGNVLVRYEVRHKEA